MAKDDIDKKYLDEQTALEAEYFIIVPEFLNGKRIGQHRELKAGKTIEDFNTAHGQMWQNHKAELIDGGYAQPDPDPEPMRDLEAEIDELKQRIQELEARGNR